MAAAARLVALPSEPPAFAPVTSDSLRHIFMRTHEHLSRARSQVWMGWHKTWARLKHFGIHCGSGGRQAHCGRGRRPAACRGVAVSVPRAPRCSSRPSMVTGPRDMGRCCPLPACTLRPPRQGPCAVTTPVLPAPGAQLGPLCWETSITRLCPQRALGPISLASPLPGVGVESWGSVQRSARLWSAGLGRILIKRETSWL